MPENKEIDLKQFIRFAAFILFMLPLLSQALQIEFATASFIPIHWIFVIQAGIGVGLASMAGYIRDVFKKHDEELVAAIADLSHSVDITKKDRDISERDIIINSYMFNSKWLNENQDIDSAEKLLAKLKGQLPEKFEE